MTDKVSMLGEKATGKKITPDPPCRSFEYFRKLEDQIFHVSSLGVGGPQGELPAGSPGAQTHQPSNVSSLLRLQCRGLSQTDCRGRCTGELALGRLPLPPPSEGAPAPVHEEYAGRRFLTRARGPCTRVCAASYQDCLRKHSLRSPRGPTCIYEWDCFILVCACQ